MTAWSGWASLVLSLLTLLFVFGYWKGKVDTRLNALWETRNADAKLLAELSIKSTTIWDVYVTSVLTREQQRRGHSKADALFPQEWDTLTNGICFTLPVAEVGFRVINLLGIREIQRVAEATGRSFGEIVAEFLLLKIMPKQQ